MIMPRILIKKKYSQWGHLENLRGELVYEYSYSVRLGCIYTELDK